MNVAPIGGNGSDAEMARMNARVWLALTFTGAALATGPSCGTAETSTTSTPPPGCAPIYYGGGTLPTPPDGASLCADGVCNYQTQAGCAANETCSLEIDQAKGTVAPGCRPAGSLAKGSPCDAKATTTAGRCAPGLYCSTTGCRKFCCGGDWSACDPGESCIRQLVVELGDASIPAEADLCLPVNDCDPLDPKACASEGRVCRIADPIGNVACMPPSNLGVGDPCDEAHQCGATLHCSKESETAPGHCHHLCSFGACVNNTCGDEGTCVHFNRNPDGIGECVPGWSGPGTAVDGGVPVDAGSTPN
jgi:hypothetical protein